MNLETNLLALKRILDQELPFIEQALLANIKSLPPSIYEVALHVLKAGGKRLRPFLTILFAKILGYTQKDVYDLAAAMEIFHSATLIHDDVLDNSSLRRGQKASHLTFGTTKAILAGDGLLALGNSIVASFGQPVLTQVVSKAILNTAYGEIREIEVSGQPISQDFYLEIITGKTAYLIAAACQCGAILANYDQQSQEAAYTYGLNLGIAFQLVDDALDYSPPSSAMGKPQGQDLKEGKITLPFLLYLETLSPKQKEQILNKTAKQDLSEAEVQKILADIQDKGLEQKVKKMAQKYLDVAQNALSHLPQHPLLDTLKIVLRYVAQREN